MASNVRSIPKVLPHLASLPILVLGIFGCPTPPGDTIPPEIFLAGHEHATVEQFSNYIDAGAIATDNLDGDVSASISIMGTVNTGALGLYELTFTATDSSGNASSVSRAVEVIPIGAVVFEQGVNSFSGFEDTSIFELSPNNSGGGQDAVFSGTIRTGELIRGLVRADVTSILSGTTVVSVEVRMTVDLSGGNSLEGSYGLHVVTNDWGEGNVVDTVRLGGAGAPADAGDATWTDNFFQMSTWANVGGDFVETSSATVGAGQHDDVVTWSSAEMAADVQTWIDTPSQNFGWAIVSTIEGTNQRTQRYYSSEAEANRPRLTIITN